jgi:hypothetical protein
MPVGEVLRLGRAQVGLALAQAAGPRRRRFVAQPLPPPPVMRTGAPSYAHGAPYYAYGQPYHAYSTAFFSGLQKTAKFLKFWPKTTKFDLV